MQSDWETKVTRARETVAANRAEQAAMKIAFLPKAQALAKLDAWLDVQIANATEWRVPSLEFCRSDYDAKTIMGLDGTMGVNTLIPALRPQLREYFAAQIEAEYAQRNDQGMPIAARDKRMAELVDKLYEAELAEERIIVDAERDGVMIARRPDINPKVLVAVL